MSKQSISNFLTKGMTPQQLLLLKGLSAIVLFAAVYVFFSSRMSPEEVAITPKRRVVARTETTPASGFKGLLQQFVTPASYELMTQELAKALKDAKVFDSSGAFACEFPEYDVQVSGKVADFIVTSAEFGDVRVTRDALLYRSSDEKTFKSLEAQEFITKETIYGLILEQIRENKKNIGDMCKAASSKE